MLPSAVPASPAYYSMSKLRTFYSDGGCTYRFHLKYQLGYKEKISSAAFLGGIAHTMIQQAYHGIALPDAHRRAWKQSCSPIFQALQAWYVLDEACQASGKARTKARQLWVEQHPQYAELAQEIEAYKGDFLGQDYTWAKSALLTNYYRWSVQLTKVKPERLLYPSPTLVEGLSVWDEHGCMIERFRDEHGMPNPYRLLFGEINGYPAAGVPDVFAIDSDGNARIADYKRMKYPMTVEALSQDEQLALYAELLRQNGYIVPGQRVYVGQSYLMDDIAEDGGIEWVWTLPSPHALPRLAKHLAYMDRHVKEDDFIPIRGIATGPRVPCLSCGLAYVCPTSLANEEIEPLDEEDL